jgi:hypothetical protein
MTNHNDDPSHAVVCFWDHTTFSACVMLDGLTRSDLAELIMLTVRRKVERPAIMAAYFTHYAMEVAEQVAITNVPPAVSVGATLARIHSPDNAPGGLGMILIDLAMCEIMVYGGAGWDDDGKYNQFATRVVTPSDLEPFLPIRFEGTALEAQQAKSAMTHQTIKTIYDGAEGVAKAKKKSSKKKDN